MIIYHLHFAIFQSASFLKTFQMSNMLYVETDNVKF